MNKGRRTAGEWKFRREDYKKIKQMDRQQTEYKLERQLKRIEEEIKV